MLERGRRILLVCGVRGGMGWKFRVSWDDGKIQIQRVRFASRPVILKWEHISIQLTRLDSSLRFVGIDSDLEAGIDRDFGGNFGFCFWIYRSSCWRRWRKCERLIFVDAGIWVFIFARVSKKGAWGVSELIFPVRALQRWIDVLNWASWDDLVFSSGDLDQDSIELGSLLGYWHPEAGSKLVCSLPPCGPP